jgi:hypothetical protein
VAPPIIHVGYFTPAQNARLEFSRCLPTKFSENQISDNSLSERMTIYSKIYYTFKSYPSGNQQQRTNSLAALTSSILPNCVLFGADFTMLESVLADTEVSFNKRMDANKPHPSFTVEFRLILS